MEGIPHSEIIHLAKIQALLLPSFLTLSYTIIRQSYSSDHRLFFSHHLFSSHHHLSHHYLQIQIAIRSDGNKQRKGLEVEMPHIDRMHSSLLLHIGVLVVGLVT